MENENYSIRVAHYPFTCPITGILVRRGDEYVEREGVALSLKAGLPARRLRPLMKKTA